MKNLTKKQIVKTLRTENTTLIYAIAKKYGVDINSKRNVKLFIEAFAPTKSILKKAYELAYGSPNMIVGKDGRSNRERAIDYVKRMINNGYSNYSKILIAGKSNIYFAHPEYQHSDYNKRFAFPNTPENRAFMGKVNEILKIKLSIN